MECLQWSSSDTSYGWRPRVERDPAAVADRQREVSQFRLSGHPGNIVSHGGAAAARQGRQKGRGDRWERDVLRNCRRSPAYCFGVLQEAGLSLSLLVQLLVTRQSNKLD